MVDSPIRSTDSVRMGFQVVLSSSRDIDIFRLSTNIRHIINYDSIPKPIWHGSLLADGHLLRPIGTC